MKTSITIFRPGILALIMMLCSFTFASRAQTLPYTITNNLSCPVRVTWVVYDPINCQACNSSTVVIAGFSGTTTIPVTVACTNSPCEIKVVLTHVGGTSLIPNGAVSSAQTSDSGAIPCAAGCCAGAPTWSMLWTTTSTTIN